MADCYNANSVNSVKRGKSYFNASRDFWTAAKDKKLDIENFHAAYDGKGNISDDFFEPNGLLKSDAAVRKQIFNISIRKDNKTENDWANLALKKFWSLQFNTPGVTIIESPAIKNWLQAQNKQTTIASSGAGTQSCVDNVLKLTNDIINNTLPTMNKIMKSAWTSFAIEQEKAELKSLLYGLHPTDLGKDIIYKLLDNDGVHPVIDGPFIFINEKYGKSDRDYKYLIDGRGHAIDKADLSDYFDFFARTRQGIDLQNNSKIYLGVLFDGAQYNNAIQRVQCHLESNGYFDTFYAEVPLSDIIFDQNEDAEAGNYLQFDISDFGRLQSSVLLLEVDMNNNEKNIAFDWRDESAWIQFFTDIFEEAMNRVSDAYSHVDDFDAKVINRTQTKQKEQEKKDQETRAKIVEDNALAKEGYDNIQSKVNNDQQPNTNFISKLNDIAKQARANAEKQAAEWADTTDGSSGAAYAGEIRSGALELARYLRDCHFTVDGEEWDPAARPGIRINASTNHYSTDWNDLRNICAGLITESGFAISKVKFIKD